MLRVRGDEGVRAVIAVGVVLAVEHGELQAVDGGVVGFGSVRARPVRLLTFW